MKGPEPRVPLHGSLRNALRAAALKQSGVTFVDLKEGEQTLKWREIYDRARRVAGRLAQLGVRPQDRVALVLSTGPDFLDAFFGVSLAGAVPVPLAPPQRLGRLDEFHAATARMLQVCGARLVLTDERVRRLLGVAVATASPVLGCHTVESMRSSEAVFEIDAPAEAVAVIQFSSGSTVDPKPVALTQANLMAQLASIDQMLPPPKEGKRVGACWLPMHHDMGLIGCLLGAMYQGITLVMLAPEHFLARPSLWLRAISRHRVTVSAAPSFAYALCLKRISDHELEGVDLSRWSYALNGAEPVSVGVLEAFAERFSKWGFRRAAQMPVYGMAEASLGVTFTPPGASPRWLQVDPAELARHGRVVEGGRRVASVGRPMPGVEVVVRDDEGDEVAERRLGRIWVRSPSVMAGYFGDVEGTARALVDGWLDTGDLGFVDEDELFVTGRAKDVVVIRGANHAPQEFEECLEGIEGLRTGCAVAVGFVPDSDDGRQEEGEELLILAERSSERPEAALVEDIRNAVLQRTGIRPRTIRLLPPGTLPRTTSGKLRRSEALRQYQAGELRPPLAVSQLRLAAAMARSSAAFAMMRVLGAR